MIAAIGVSRQESDVLRKEHHTAIISCRNAIGRSCLLSASRGAAAIEDNRTFEVFTVHRPMHAAMESVFLSAKFPLPAILLANDLLAGDVVFWTGADWMPDPAQALVAHQPAQAAALEAAARAATASNRVVDAYLVDVTLREDGLPVPNHFRERFKIKGPSTRPDLGKQAVYAHLSGSLRDVSL